MKGTLTLLAKFGVTLAIFVGIFLEFGGGYRAVATARLREPGAFETANPAFPGLLGQLRARLGRTSLPPPRLPVAIDQVCVAAVDRPVFVHLDDGTFRRFKPLRHCGEGGLVIVYARTPEGAFAPVPLPEAPPEVYFRIQGFQLVPAEMSELWTEIRSLTWRVFLPWFVAAMAIKLLGIFANVWRWKILLRGQGLELGFGYLANTYFIGRYFGIVTPSTMGLDAWRLYDTIRLTRRPVECTTVLAVERVLGLVGLFTVILLFMPFAGRITQGQSFGELVAAMKVPLAATTLFGVLILLQPARFRGLLRLVPGGRVRRFAASVIDSATAYSNRRGHLLLALVLAVVGQITTTLMYFANAMSLGTQNVRASEVLFASAVMTFGTFVAPSASGEGVRELVFVWLLGSKAGAAKAFLIGNLGFWIEKVPLSVPGGLLLLLRRDPSLRAITREDLERVRREVEAV
ncbi:MAG TPA: lysylphosphatidylglycerol synthase transmembrane domain-containing protein [Gemmatimonadales bacterium]|nr:lysylphosphatidylglycerol synthase transmembrane domain-containing protein [Gemmatimonadales bacterium]